MGTLKNLKMENLLNAKCLRALAFCRLQVNPNRDIWVGKQEMKGNQGSLSGDSQSKKKYERIFSYSLEICLLPPPHQYLFSKIFDMLLISLSTIFPIIYALDLRVGRRLR